MTSLKAAFAHLAERLLPRAPEVPPDLEACEFACRERDCCQGRWESCAKRLRYADARRARDTACKSAP